MLDVVNRYIYDELKEKIIINCIQASCDELCSLVGKLAFDYGIVLKISNIDLYCKF